MLAVTREEAHPAPANPEAVDAAPPVVTPAVSASEERLAARTVTASPDAADTHAVAPMRPEVSAEAGQPPAAAAAVGQAALTMALDQVADLLLQQIAQKLGAFVTSQRASLERTGQALGSQRDGTRARLDALTQQLGGAWAAPPPPTDRPGTQRAATADLYKVPALLIGVPTEYEAAIRERFGDRYTLQFLDAEAKFGKVRAIRDQYPIILGLEESGSPAIKDALQGHPHKAILPHPAQLIDELEEFFLLQQEQAQYGDGN